VGWAIYRGKKEIIKRVVEKTSREVVWYGEGGGSSLENVLCMDVCTVCIVKWVSYR